MVTSMYKCKGILFDFDGTLANTMQNHYHCWKSVFGAIGVNLSEKDYYPMEGASLMDIAKKFSKFSDPKELEVLVRNKKDRYINLYKKKISFYPGVSDLVNYLSTKMPLGIVTGGHRDQLENTVPREFLRLFSTIVCGDETEKNKPYPDPYQTAARKLELNTAECVVVENAPLGIKSALNAGCYCIAVTTTCNKVEVDEAHEIVEKIVDITKTKIINNF